MRFANLIIDNDVIQIIDFDDCGFGWHMYDLAAALSFIETSEHLQDYIGAWLEGYSSLRAVSDEDMDAIPSLIMMRRMQLTAWTASRWDSDPIKELFGFAEETVRLAEKYLDRL